ncbi:class I SAM-dependent methyltransferase [Fructobacillus fructosus]|uniref:tRNA (adenine(22)-N(1))-methyltransferase n=1 Tax=Fructobacillus fructosus TaxID=1631 RepID=UPI002DA7840E|nr:tRNA A22 N1-methylase (TrmK) [Fructobacillus fructosus]CAK1227746.1 tRNA A22 N1-methylase (TrmK) [Fructobacillus fructosus]CAK1227893.1 tRNA A22 N1-methylase (TrmK) [Fructobacillus fructosus]
MSHIKLSPRLAAVAQLVETKQKMADIGSDHAYLASALVEQGKVAKAIVGEVAEGPLQNAKSTVFSQGLTGLIDCRLADGLAALSKTDEVETVVIAGMGGLLIKKILEDGQALGPFQQLVLQPNTDQEALRAWLVQNGYRISQEKMVAEGVHRYEIIVAHPGQQKLSAEDLTFGPFLRKDKGPVFVAKWQHERDRLALVLKRLEDAQQTNSMKYAEVKRAVGQIEKELD